MKTRIALGTVMLLTLGSAVAGSFIYGGRAALRTEVTVAAPVISKEVTPEMIALWKATATSSDYTAPRVPI